MSWSTEDAHFCVEAYFACKSYKTVQCQYRKKMRCKKAPAINLVCAWVKEFKEFGSVENLEISSKFLNSGYGPARTEENINAVRKSVATNPEKSLIDLSQELGVSAGSLHKILTLDLNLQVKNSHTATIGGTGRKSSVLNSSEKSLGSAVHLGSKNGRPTACTEENITAVRRSFAQNPEQSIKDRSKELEMPQSLVYRIIKMDNLQVKQSRVEKNIYAVWKSVAQNPEQSIRERSKELGMPVLQVKKILKMDIS